MIDEANKLIKEISDSPIWITGSISLKEVQDNYLRAGTPDPFRMKSTIPPVPLRDIPDTSILYHPGTYLQDVITGTYYVPTPRPPPPPVMRESSLGMKPLKNIEETVKERYPELYNNAHGRRDKWSEWKYLFKKLHAWWERDFGQKEKDTCSPTTKSSTESASTAGPQKVGSSPPQPVSEGTLPSATT